MIPVMLDPELVQIGLVGDGPLIEKRAEKLRAQGANNLIHRRSVPEAKELADIRVLWIADIDEGRAAKLADTARAMNILVNVEDVLPWCDFHKPAVVKRGDLTVTVATAGKSPGLSRRLRKYLEYRMGPEWEDRLEELARLRHGWRAQGHELKEVARLTDEHITKEGWLP